MDFEPLQDVGLLLVRLFEPEERIFVIAESSISVHKGSGRNVPCVPALFQLGEEPKGVRAPSRMGIGPDQHSDNPWTTVGTRKRLLQNGDCFLRLIVGDQRKSKKSESKGIVVTAGLEEDPPDVNAGNRKGVEFPASLNPRQRLFRSPVGYKCVPHHELGMTGVVIVLP